MLGNVLALLASATLLILGFMFSVVVLAVAAVLGLALWGYVLWKTRKLRRAMQEQAAANNGHVIDGEAVVVEEYSVTTKNVLPGEPGQAPSTQNREYP